MNTLKCSFPFDITTHITMICINKPWEDLKLLNTNSFVKWLELYRDLFSVAADRHPVALLTYEFRHNH